MKLLLKMSFIVVLGFVFSGYSYQPEPVGYSKDSFWFCKFVGHTKDDIRLLAISDVFMYSQNVEYDDIEGDFEDATYNQLNGNFVSDFPARCMDFETARLARKHYKRQKDTAKGRGYKIFHISFP